MDIPGPVYRTSRKYQEPAVVAFGITASVIKAVVLCRLCQVLNHAPVAGDTLPPVPTVPESVPDALLEGVCCVPPVSTP